MRKPFTNVDIFKQRRDSLKSKLEGSALVLIANREKSRNHDVDHPFRQESSFLYLTGFEEPDAVFVFRPGKSPETTLFVRPKDPHMETWNGFRYGKDGAKSSYQMDACYELSELEDRLIDQLKEVDRVYYSLANTEFDDEMNRILMKVRSSFGRSGKGLLPVEDPAEILGEARVKKSDQEMKWMREACALSTKAHINAMKFTVPGVNERQVMAVLEYTFKMGGSDRVGYHPIVATGNNATTLHYNFNDQPCEDGDVLLIDAGTEINYYSADITRSFPVNGKFSDAQKKVYEIVLKAQKAAVEMVKPGVSFVQLQDKAVDILVDGMRELGLLSESKEKIVSEKLYKKYYPHNISHYLGLDVHDAGLYTINNEPRPLEPGMVLTVEPGLYIPQDDTSAPDEFRGIGIRIEDNVLVTDGGHENLTETCPREISEIEALVGTGLGDVI